jgi:DNA-binding SARP family transcriptional activator/tetratricopeptide (TPR) repeat protein
VGEPGVGKTHTAQMILEQVPCHHLNLHASSNEGQIVAALPKFSVLPAWVQSQLARLERGESLEAETFVSTLVAVLTGLAPFVLHLEDLHEVDAERLALIQSLARSVTRTRGLGLLVTGRAELSQVFHNHRLESLSITELATLMEHELKADPPSDGLEWLFARTLGNPLFALEFVHYLIRQGFLWSDGQHWNWRAPGDDFVPITVDALISQLTLSLTTTPEALATLEARAILPGEATAWELEPVWAEVAGLQRDVLLVAATALERGGLFNGGRFAHPLFGEITRRDMPTTRRKLYALRALNALETLDPVLAADYVDDADLEPLEAVTRLEWAARQLQVSDPNRAAHMLGIAAERSTGAERLRLALEAELWLQASGPVQRRVQLSRLALEAEPENREARYRLTVALAMTGNVEEIQRLIRTLPNSERSEVRWVSSIFRAQARGTHFVEALQTWQDHPELMAFAGSMTDAAHTYANLGDFHNAEIIIEQALEMPELQVQFRSNLVGLLAFIRSEQGQLDEAQGLHDQGLALAYQDSSSVNLAANLYNCSFNLSRLGRYHDAIKSLEEAIRLYDQGGHIQYGANARTILGVVLARMGRFNEAEKTILEGHDILVQFEVGHGLANAEWELGLLYAEWRPPHGGVLALKFARSAVGHSRELNNKRCLAGALPAAARVEAWDGNPAIALQLAQEALGLDLTSVEDTLACDLALAIALEANDQRETALAQWKKTFRSVQVLDVQREIELEIARLENNRQRGLELLEWAEQRGLGAMTIRARRYFPVDESEPEISPTPGVRLEVLGSIRLFNNDQLVPSRARKRLEILLYLLETRIAGHSEAGALELVDALYPNMPEPEARKALKQLVYLNRSGLGADSIISTPTGYALGAVSSDAEDFLKTADSSLWRGAYLSSLTDGWHPNVREALTLELQTKAESLLEANPSEAARLGSMLLEMEPFDLQVLRLTVTGYEQSGNAQAARMTYFESRSRLFELGETLPETLDLFLTP